jgi:hypothetical protein
MMNYWAFYLKIGTIKTKFFRKDGNKKRRVQVVRDFK